MIDDDRHGLLVPERDLEALAAALEALLDDQALRARLGAAAAERARDELDLVARTVELERIYARFTGRPMLREIRGKGRGTWTV